jgi:hypothetical protein
MKCIIVAFSLAIATTSWAAAEIWTCTFPGLISKMTVREQMDINANQVIRDGEMAYHIVENNARGVVATYVRSQPPQAAMTIGTLAIDKTSGHFVISVMVPGDPLANKVVSGRCEKSN